MTRESVRVADSRAAVRVWSAVVGPWPLLELGLELLAQELEQRLGGDSRKEFTDLLEGGFCVGISCLDAVAPTVLFLRFVLFPGNLKRKETNFWATVRLKIRPWQKWRYDNLPFCACVNLCQGREGMVTSPGGRILPSNWTMLRQKQNLITSPKEALFVLRENRIRFSLVTRMVFNKLLLCVLAE